MPLFRAWTEIIMPPWDRVDGYDAHGVLREQSYRGARYRYGGDLAEVVVDRLEHELRIIRQMRYSSYFLVVRDIIHPLQQDGSRKRRRICGRGSGAASLVAYCLGITNVVRSSTTSTSSVFSTREETILPTSTSICLDERDAVLARCWRSSGIISRW